MDPRDADESSKIIESAIHEAYGDNTTALTFDHLYSHASRLVQNNLGQKLYNGILTTMSSHINEMKRSIEQAWSNNYLLFLQELTTNWTKHNKAFHMLKPVYMCMDTNCTPSTHKFNVQELGVQLWVDDVIYSGDIRRNVTSALLDMVQTEREDQAVNRDLLKSVLKMLMDLGESVYKEVFEEHFIQITQCVYKPQSEDMVENHCCGYYLKETEKYLNDEMERISDYLDFENDIARKSLAKMKKLLLVLTVTNQMTTLLDKGLITMIVGDMYDDLARMYNLFRRVPDGTALIRDMMMCHVQRTVYQLVVTNPENVKDTVSFVQRLLDEKDKYEKIIHLSYNDDVGFQTGLNFVFKYMVNWNPRIPVYISLFVDDTLRKSENEDDVAIVLDKIMVFIGYLSKKDVFEEYYEKHMGKRLSSGVDKNVNEDAEKMMISKLKKECGSRFTSKLEAMLSEMKTSQV
ncbi:cullin-3B-like [Rutidosis leptorrhynchoides]|uniref:cullin-3B-like n=1 Tax=Rutidosis leptorrhynchoides TaxID=125765 RepID=UPI003A98ED05